MSMSLFPYNPPKDKTRTGTRTRTKIKNLWTMTRTLRIFGRRTGRHRLGSPMTVSAARKNGYLSAYYANLFADYCDERWRVV